MATRTRKVTPKDGASASKVINDAAKAKRTTKGKAAKAEAPKRDRIRNAGKTCATRGCSHPARRRGLCSGKGSAGHYRAALRAERRANDKDA